MPEAGTREVEIENDAVIDVEIESDGEPQVAVTEPAKPAATAQEPAVKSAADEAAALLTAALEKERKDREGDRRAREAAEATAQAERRRADEATRLALQNDQRAQEALEQVADSRLTAITAGIDAATRELESAKTELLRSQEAGEFPKAADAQVRISRAAAALDRLDAEKASFEQQAARKPEARTEPLASQASPFEQYVSGFSPMAQAWLRSHPDCVPAQIGGNAKKNAAMMKGHYAALEEDAVEGSPDYFRIIEEHIGQRQPTSAAATITPAEPEPQPKPKPQQRAIPAAPVTRDPPAASNGQTQRQRVSLNAQQQEVALFSYPAKPGEDESAWRKRAFGTYATELVKATSEGKIGRLSH